MDFETQLLHAHSKENSLVIQRYIGQDQDRFKRFVSTLWSTDKKIAQRSGMVFSACFDAHPELIEPHLENLIELAMQENIQVAIKRNIIRALQFIKIPESHQSLVFDFGIGILHSPNEAIAVKAFMMQVLVNLCREYPDLKQELLPVLEAELGRNTEKGVQARGRAMLKQLQKI